VDNAISYRRGKQVPEADILAFLVKEYGEHAAENPAFSDGSLAVQIDLSDSELPPKADTEVGDCDILNSVAETRPEQPDVLTSSLNFPQREITDAEVAAMIERMRNIQVSHLHHIGEGVVIEMPLAKTRTESEPEIQKPAEPLKDKDSEGPAESLPLPGQSRPLNSVRRIFRRTGVSEPAPLKEKTTEAVPMRLAPRPSPTKTIFSTLALVTLIGFMSYYLIAATETLYGRGIATLLVLIPLAFVFFVKIPVVRYLALALFLGVDLLSVGALHKIETAGISVSTLDGNPEYQRLKIQYAKGELERDGINVRTHPSLRDQKAEELKKISGRMAEIESTSRVTEQASAEKSRADVTLGVRALLLVAAAVFAHALLHYTVSIDFDRWVRKAFGRG
jgi:hypothetical protein